MTLALVKPHAQFHLVARRTAAKSRRGRKPRPIVVHPSHGVFRPTTLFFIELAQWKNATHGTLEGMAYILCDWLNFLQGRGAVWNAPDERHYLTWLHDQVETGQNGKRVQGRKASVVMRFYRFLATDTEHRLDANVVDFAKAISATALDSADEPRARFKAAGAPRLKHGRRPVPSDAEVRRVVDGLAGNPDPFLAERDWLMARTAFETGLRAMGLQKLDISFLNALLRSDKIIETHVSVDAISKDADAKGAVRRRLRELAETGRTHLIGRVVEKRGSQRDVAFSIELVLAMLVHIWGERAALFRSLAKPPATRKTAKRRAARSGNKSGLWCSATTGERLVLGTVKNVLKAGFNDAKVKGSGHALRAAFLTTKACELIRKARKTNGPNVDCDALLPRLMEIVGHEDEVTLRHYLDEARVREALFDAADAAASSATILSHQNAE